MTVAEMAERIKNYCEKRTFCSSDSVTCPLYDIDGVCYEDERLVERNYEILFPSGTCNDPVNHPSHYTQGGIECIDAMVSAFGKEAVAHFCICNAFKYIFRYRLKNGKEDIEKAQWYLNKFKELSYDEEAV